MAVNGVAAGGGLSFALSGDVVIADGEFAGAVRSFAKELAQGPTRAFGGAKLLFHQSTTESLETQMELEAQAIAAAGRSEDFREAVRAFAEKKAPVFRGR